MKRSLFATMLALTMLTLSACAQEGSIFEDIGQNVATPNAMWIDAAGARLYLVNSNAQVLYNWEQGSFQVLDLTSPLAPTLMNTLATQSFSGEIYVDQVLGKAYMPNRFSEDDDVREDKLYVIDIAEGTADYLTYATQALGRDPYAISCCYPENRAWITTSLNELQYVDITNVTTPGSIALDTELDNGGSLSHAEVNHSALKEPQLFLSREYGGVLVVNLDDAGVSGEVAVDYFISDLPNPRGIATDGTYLYVVGEGEECDGDWCGFLAILDVTGLTPLTGNTQTISLDKEEDGLLVALIEVGEYPQEVLLTSQYAFVTNQEDDTVSVIDLATRAKVTDIASTEEPFSLALYTTEAEGDQYVYVGNVESNTLSIIDIPSLTVVATYP